MKIFGLQKTTLLDYPGHVAATVFLGGCNFRCPFCHNGEIISGNSEDAVTEDSVLAFLQKRSSILEAVCITGGEPTLYDDLEDFIVKIRSLGLLIKLDTNGYRPEVLKDLCEKKLLSYVAMDIKSGPTGYAKAAGCSELDISRIEQSINFLKKQDFPYEFRTTVVKELHRKEDFHEIGPWIAGCPAYYLQSYKASEHVLSPGLSACSKETLLSFAKITEPYVGRVSLRGIDF